ncbi:MAG: hypothetical protein EPO64_06295 [Nitrospirae bacterium]|nr:MAG: hypothetical protein EPO64_06295 [Nitrospirota bacterium]
MNPQLSPLIELQALDLRIGEIKEHQRKTPELIDAAEVPLREASRLLKEATAIVDLLVKERRERERDLEAHEAQVDKLKTRLTELKTNKEYQAHLFEIEMAGKKRGEFEEQILVLMDRVEQKQQEVKQFQAKVAELERIFAQEKRRLEDASAAFVSELSQLEQKQGTLAAAVDKSLLARYTKLKATRKELALAPIRNGTCGGCRLQLPPQLVAEVKRSDEVQTCSYCHRILYWEGEVVSSAASPPASLQESEADVEETV